MGAAIASTVHRLADYRLQESEDINRPGTGTPIEWYATPLDRKLLKGFVQRSDARAAANFALWFGLLGAAGALAYAGWGSWWALPAFLVYGIVYSSCDSRWHELSHGTVFRTRWLNEALYHLCSFMTFREAIRWRWSHARHHTHTIVVGKDPEIHATRPPSLAAIASGLLYLKGGTNELRMVFKIATGRIPRDVALYVPRGEWAKMILSSRVYAILLVAIAAACVAVQSVWPAFFVVTPRWYGGFLHYLQAMTQHIGRAEDVRDHRRNARTVLMNPVLRFLYSNMNYHIEHHMYPMVPFYNLPALHAAIAHDLPPPSRGLLAAWREILPILLRQRKDPSHYFEPDLPGEKA